MLAESSTTAQATGEALWRFGSFVLWERQRRLERHGQAVRLGARTFDLLLQLLRRGGEVVSNRALLDTVWHGVVVEEASVRVHISILRKALGEPEPQDECREWIANVPMRGYCFVGRVQCQRVEGVEPGGQRRAVPALARQARAPEAVDSAGTMQALTQLASHAPTPPQPGPMQWRIQRLPGDDLVLFMDGGGHAAVPLPALIAQLLECLLQSRAEGGRRLA